MEELISVIDETDEKKRPPPSRPHQSGSQGLRQTRAQPPRQAGTQQKGQSNGPGYSPFQALAQQQQSSPRFSQRQNSNPPSSPKYDPFTSAFGSTSPRQNSKQDTSSYSYNQHEAPRPFGRPAPDPITSRVPRPQYGNPPNRFQQDSLTRERRAPPRYQPPGDPFRTIPLENRQSHAKLLALQRSRAEERARHPELTLDEDIQAYFIRIPGPNNTLSPPTPPYQILREIDREETWLHQIDRLDPVSGVAVCRILNKKEYLKTAWARRKQEKERKKQTEMTTPKQVEINWTIGPNDLNHKMKQTREFLEKGRRVDVLVAAKEKRWQFQRAKVEEAGRVVEAVKGQLHEIGAAEWKGSSGTLPESVVLHLQARK